MFRPGPTLGIALNRQINAVDCLNTNHAQRNYSSDKFKLPSRLGVVKRNVWAEYTQFTADIKPKVNLGQGFPDFHPPSHLTEALSKIALSDNPLASQYSRGFGYPKLVENLAKLYSPFVSRTIDPLTEVLITVGGYEALLVSILGLVEQGDEVIVIEPYFDCYEFMIKCAGGTPKYIPLKAKKTSGPISAADWVLDEQELAGLFNSKTKMIIINTPNNPTGKVFSMEELTFIADLCKKHNVICVADQVYEWMVYEPKELIRTVSLPGMWDRTITIGSAGKSFSVTGWKIGWAYTNTNLMPKLQTIHQSIISSCCTPVQMALAEALDIELARRDTPEMYMKSFCREIRPKRDFFLEALVEIGFSPVIPEAGYLILADWTKIGEKLDLSTESDKYKDFRFTKKFAKETGVLAIPATAFYHSEHKHLGEKYCRFCVAKKDKNLKLAVDLMKSWAQKK